VPSALSGGAGLFSSWAEIFGMNFFDTMDYLASNWLLPTGGLLIALYVGWVMSDEQRRRAFGAEEHHPGYYAAFNVLIRYVAPAMVFIVLLHKIGILQELGLVSE